MINGQYSSPPFGMDGVASTGAPGSEPAPAATAPVSSPERPFLSPVLEPYQLGQAVDAAPSMVTPQYSHGTDVTPGGSGYGSTGAGAGSAEHIPHPNADGRP